MFLPQLLDGATVVRLLGTETIDGAAADVVGFVQPAYPARHRLWINRATGRIRRLEMRADRHVMDQRYSAFDTPVTIRPPTDIAEAN